MDEQGESSPLHPDDLRRRCQQYRGLDPKQQFRGYYFAVFTEYGHVMRQVRNYLKHLRTEMLATAITTPLGLSVWADKVDEHIDLIEQRYFFEAFEHAKGHALPRGPGGFSHLQKMSFLCIICAYSLVIAGGRSVRIIRSGDRNLMHPEDQQYATFQAALQQLDARMEAALYALKDFGTHGPARQQRERHFWSLERQRSTLITDYYQFRRASPEATQYKRYAETYRQLVILGLRIVEHKYRLYLLQEQATHFGRWAALKRSRNTRQQRRLAKSLAAYLAELDKRSSPQPTLREELFGSQPS